MNPNKFWMLLSLLILLAAAGCTGKKTQEGIGGGLSQEGCVCIQVYEPVCGSDGKTYSNSCFADCAKVTYSKGEC